ncbi:MAG: hypothetical protein JO326_02120 [Acetobacteraceae bacterium]|nr:hypothetical protein [Acetobacteraceae bacterium]
MTAVADLSVVERLRVILSGMRTYVGLRAYYVFGYNVRLMALCMDGLTRRSQRFFRLAAAIEAGTLRPLRPRAPRPADPSPGAPSSPRAQRSGPSSGRLPSRFGWLRLALEQSLGARFDDGELDTLVRSYEALLDDPDVRRLYDLAPERMGRLLRPMLHVCGRKPPEWLRLPRRKPRPKAEAPVPDTASRHRKPRSRAAIQEHRRKPPEPPPQPAPPPPEPAPPGGDYRHIFDPMNGAQMAERSRAWDKRQRQQEELQRRYPGRRLLW